MDIAAHSLWALVLLPGSPSAEKVLFAILPDIAVFIPDLVSSAIKGEKRNFHTRQEMMKWYKKPQNHWKVTLYKWTHSLILWLPFIAIITLLRETVPWFLFAAVIHILMDIPTHTRDSFPVEFLTPLSNYKIDGWHWSSKSMIIGNYFLIILVFYLRLYIFRY